MNHNFTDDQIKEARTRLWYMGNLEWKLDPTQKRIYEFWKGVEIKTSVINCSRRLGKSYLLTIIAIQQCIQKPGSIIKFLQPEQKMIRVNIRPIMNKILKDCPPELYPTFKTMDNIYIFPNGSEIQLAGTDNGNHEKLRGGDADLCLIDEAGFVKSQLEYIVTSVLLPTTMLTGGKIILSSTSPVEPDHDFAKYMEQAEMDNAMIKITIDDALADNEGVENPRFTPEIVEDFARQYAGGRASDGFRREMLCEIITDGDNAIIPEFVKVEEDIVVDWPRPAFCDRYVAMDIGFKDLTVVLFGYYDFINGVIVIEDEIVINGPKMTTEKLAYDIITKEKQLWTDPLTGEYTPAYLRISDNNLIVINDLQRLHSLTFLATAKDNKEAAINNVRVMMDNRQIYINPRCKTLIHHLKYGVWDSKRKNFVRSPDNGHYDAIDALIYLARNVDKSKNPFPKDYRYRHIGNSDDIFVNPNYRPDAYSYEAFKDLFKVRKSHNKKGY